MLSEPRCPISTNLATRPSTWLLVISRREIGEYRAKPAHGTHLDPKWSKVSMERLLGLAFPEEKQISSPDHAVLAKLRGE